MKATICAPLPILFPSNRSPLPDPIEGWCLSLSKAFSLHPFPPRLSSRAGTQKMAKLTPTQRHPSPHTGHLPFDW